MRKKRFVKALNLVLVVTMSLCLAAIRPASLYAGDCEDAAADTYAAAMAAFAADLGAAQAGFDAASADYTAAMQAASDTYDAAAAACNAEYAIAIQPCVEMMEDAELMADIFYAGEVY